MKARLNTLKEVEQELNIRLGGSPGKAPDAAASWEFRGMRSIKQRMRGSARGGRARKTSVTSTFSGNPRQQRVIVKASYTTHHAEKVAGVLRAHVKYLGRDAASMDGREGRFYDATQEGIDAKQRVHEWQDDARHFRFIVSPEQGHEINEKNGGLTAYTRELMQRVEKDLGTKLEWIAINHHNTDDLHTHLLVRGRRNDGKDLRIDRQYIQRGMRQVAQEIATHWLGERSEQQITQAVQKELKADRYTALDAFVERHVGANRQLQLDTRGTAAGREQRRRVAARLQHLESMGLASRDRYGRWTVDVELKPKLHSLAQRNDIIKNLYASLGPRSASVASYRGERELVGIVAGRGTHDELRDRSYLLVRDAACQLHYVRVANGEALAVLEEGSLVRVAGMDPQRARTDARIAEMARLHGDIYRIDAHRASLPAHFAGRDIESFLRSHERRLMTLQKLGAATRVERGWQITDVDRLARGELAHLRGGLGIVQVLSARSVESQIAAEAWTWLDRQIHRQARVKTTEVPFDSTLERAADDRRRWMIDHGFAVMEGGRYVLRPGTAEALRQREWQRFQQSYQEQFGKPARPLPPGTGADGKYCGSVSLHDGLYAVIASPTEAALAPIERVPPLAYGTNVEASTSTRGLAVLSRRNQRETAKAGEKDRGSERE